MPRLFFILGSASAFFGVLLGAFAAHLLKTRLDPELFAIFEVGVRYHMYHALALLAVSFAAAHWGESYFVMPGWCFFLGILIFSGSLYALSLTGVRSWGAVTPVGGALFLLGWASLVWKVYRSH